jgi:hypothetical protein
MAAFALEAHGRSVRIRVATATATAHIGRYGAAVVVTAQAYGVGVRPFEGVACFPFMIEREVIAQHIPAVRDMAHPAVTRKGVMRY